MGLGFALGKTSSNAVDVDDAGEVVTGDSDTEAFRWTKGEGFKTLPRAANGKTSYVTAISPDGTVIVALNAELPKSVGWSPEPFVIADKDQVRDVSRRGEKFLASHYDAVNKIYSGLIYRRSGLAEVVFPTATPKEMSSNGDVVIGNKDFCGVTNLAPIPALNDGLCVWAMGISGDGKYVVGTGRDSVVSPLVRWRIGSPTLEYIPLPIGTHSIFPSISSDGSSLAGEAIDATGKRFVFLWTQKLGFTELSKHLSDNGINVAAWPAFQYAKISGNGKVIVGMGKNSAGDSAAFRVVLP